MLIGQRIRQLREAQRITLTELSEKSGVQLATLSRVENLKMTGTLESHMAIAKALGVELTQLYRNLESEPPPAQKHDQKAKGEVFVHNVKSSYEILATNILNKKMMPILLKLEAGGHTNKEENVLGSEKFLFVLEGKITVKVGEQAFLLSKNNSLYFDASLKHSFENSGQTTAKAICIVTPVAL